MAQSEWIKVCQEGDLSEGAPRLFKIGEKEEVYMVRAGGKIRALAHLCPHYECKLEEGLLLGEVIVCRCHGARFNAATGAVLSPPAITPLATYPVRVEDGAVFVGARVKPPLPKVEIKEKRLFLIVGGGAAGNMAAETLRREGFSGRIVMITPEADLPYDRPNLSKEFIAGTAKPEWLPLRDRDFYANQQIEIVTGRRVISLSARQKSVTLDDGSAMVYDKVLLATGAAPRVLSVPGAKSEVCFSLRSLADARQIDKAASGAKSAALIGGGFITMELAGSLRERGLSVTVIAPEALPLARVLGDALALHLKGLHQEKGVVFHMGKTVTRISTEKKGAVLTLSDGSKVTADFVVAGIGVQPAVDYLAGTDLVQSGGVPVNGQLRTRYPDIFAAGDIALVPSPAGFSRSRGGNGGYRFEHWVAAERMGMHAARAMLGSEEPFMEVPFFWTRQAGVSVKYVGFGGEWEQVLYRGDAAGAKFAVGFFRGGVLMAAAGIGMPNDIAAIEALMRKRAPVPPDAFTDTAVDLAAMARAAGA